MKILGIIPAGIGTKQYPNRSVALFKGETLIAKTIKQTLASEYITKTIVTTDSPQIAAIAEGLGVGVINRPTSLCKGPMFPTILHTLGYLSVYGDYVPDIYVILQVTSPFRTVEDIDGTIELMLEENTRSAMSVSPGERTHTWEVYWSPDGKDPENGAVFAAYADVPFTCGECVDINSLSLYPMPASRAADIDTEEELRKAETES